MRMRCVWVWVYMPMSLPSLGKQFEGDHSLSGNVHQWGTGNGVSVCLCVCVTLLSSLEERDACHMSSLRPVYTARVLQRFVDVSIRSLHSPKHDRAIVDVSLGLFVSRHHGD